MNSLAYILAAQDFGWVNIVIILIVFGLSIIGSIYQKTKEKKEQEEKTRKPRRAPAPPEGGQRQDRARRTVQPARPVPPAAPQAEQTVRVSDELRLRQQREAKLERDRQKRLSTRVSPESDTNAIEAHLVSVHPDEADTAPMQISKVGGIASLRTLDNARKAIILHEIFSPPKALRKGGEMWDT